MTPWAVVPVKHLSGAKTRLGDTLSEDERRDLTLWMLDRVLAALLGSNCLWPVYVLTSDPLVSSRAQAAGAVILAERAPGLNPALEHARRTVGEQGARDHLVVLGDLPLLTAQVVRDLLIRADTSDASVIAPDRHRSGTNMLFLQSSDHLPALFGANSYKRHCEAAHERGIPLMTHHSEGAGFDVDTVEDLRALAAMMSPGEGPLVPFSVSAMSARLEPCEKG